MKVLITENKVFNVIYNYIDKKFDRDEINWVYGPNDDEDNEDYPDNENFLIFYKGGTWAGEEYSDIVFDYFTVDYYSDEPSSRPWKERAPVLEVIDEYGEHLDTMFGNNWKEPMKKWFQDKFNLPVKSVLTYY